MGPVRDQTVHTTFAAVALANGTSSLVNASDTGALIAYTLRDGGATVFTEYFAAGQEKLRAALTLEAATTVATVFSCVS